MEVKNGSEMCIRIKMKLSVLALINRKNDQMIDRSFVHTNVR